MFLCASINDNDWVFKDCQMISIAKCDQMNEQHHISMIFIDILCMQTIVLGAQEVYQKWRENELYVKYYGDIINMCCLLISIVQYAWWKLIWFSWLFNRYSDRNIYKSWNMYVVRGHFKFVWFNRLMIEIPIFA